MDLILMELFCAAERDVNLFQNFMRNWEESPHQYLTGERDTKFNKANVRVKIQFAFYWDFLRATELMPKY